jgi:hypothetical protein
MTDYRLHPLTGWMCRLQNNLKEPSMQSPTLLPWLMIGLACLAPAGCDEQGNTVLPRPVPPVTVTYRDSAVGLGKVVQITNSSSHHLYNVKVTGRNVGKNESASVRATEHLRPGDTVEVGWLEFESWTPIPGETIEIYCDDYALPYLSIIPEK